MYINRQATDEAYPCSCKTSRLSQADIRYQGTRPPVFLTQGDLFRSSLRRRAVYRSSGCGKTCIVLYVHVSIFYFDFIFKR